jgi:tRNA (guanine-N7-)-methyltransferase
VEQLRPWLVEVDGTDGADRTNGTGGPDQQAGPIAPLNFGELFGNDHPVEMEVGFGKGLFLLTASEARPDTNFLGVEIERKYALYTAGRLARRQRQNVRVVCADARLFLPRYITDASLAAVHVYFPDPWWKNRHRKRRVFTEEFARQSARVLKPGGQLHLVSDVAEYFATITELMASLTEFAQLPPPDLKDPTHDLDYLTNFDRKYRKEGRPIHRARYERVLGKSTCPC